jgi:subtilisin-like proprotein convertase family protein
MQVRPLCTFLLAAAVLGLSLPGSADARQGAEPFSFNLPGLVPAPTAAVQLEASDRAALVEEADRRQAEEGTPHQFADPRLVSASPSTHGTWTTLPGGDRLWQLAIDAPGATDLNVGFAEYLLPPAATLHVFSAEHAYWEGPYTSADNAPHGELWLPVIPGERAVVELYVPADAKFEPELALKQVGYGFRDFFSLEERMLRQGSCNNDVVCPEGDPWRDDIAAAAVYQLNGSWTCSGQMVNNTAGDFVPYFLTANHCGISGGNAASMVVYWNFEAPNCGDLCCGSLSDNQTGAIFRASSSASDFCLVELEEDPDPLSNVYFAGWDNSAAIPPSCVAIHHPSTDEKAISFQTDALTITTYLENTVPGNGTHWRIDQWEDGTTEPGSSGSGIWNPDHRLVGQLHGGFASCSSITSDWYGRVSVSWLGGGTAATQLKAWLDPGNTGAQVLDGSFPSGVGAVRYDSHAVADDCPSNPGNVNGLLEPGESFTMIVDVRAISDHTGITGVLTSTTSGVTIVDDMATWPNLLSGAIAPSDAPHFTVQLDETVPCLSDVEFSLSLTSAEGGPWLWAFSEAVGQAAVPSGLPVAIPDGNAAGVTHVFPVGENVVLTDVNARVEIQHTYVGDLKIELESPLGTRITLLDRPGVPASTYGCSNDNLNVTFDDASGLNLESYCAGSNPWYVGVAAPVGSLAAFNGQSTAGDWKLIVSDNAGADTGSILSWELLTTPPLNGTCEPCETSTDLPVVALPANAFGLAQSRPNPFSDATQIRFTLDRAGDARLEVFDVSGRRVRTLLDKAMPAGGHAVTWDGRDDSAQPVATGVYFYRLTSGEKSEMKRMSRLR